MKTLVTTIITTIILSPPIGVFAEESQVPKEQTTRLFSQLDYELDNTNQDSIPRERRTSRDRKSNGIGGYAGTTLGVFFPDFDEDSDIFSGSDTDINNGLGGSLFGGVKLNRYLATDLEFSFFGGDIDSDLDVDDENYTVTSIFLNPRFILPLNNNDNSLDLFLSPGIGFSTLVSSVEDEVGDFDSTTTIEDDTRFAWQVKGGASIPISSRFSILGQLRYASQTGDDAIDYFATEVGVEFDF